MTTALPRALRLPATATLLLPPLRKERGILNTVGVPTETPAGARLTQVPEDHFATEEVTILHPEEVMVVAPQAAATRVAVTLKEMVEEVTIPAVDTGADRRMVDTEEVNTAATGTAAVVVRTSKLPRRVVVDGAGEAKEGALLGEGVQIAQIGVNATEAAVVVMVVVAGMVAVVVMQVGEVVMAVVVAVTAVEGEVGMAEEEAIVE